jgi:hypothetical protein
MTENEKIINSKIANSYWYLIVMYKGTELFKDVYYKGATRIDLNGMDELVITYTEEGIDRIKKIPMHYSRVKLNMLNFLENHIKRIEWI